MLCTPVDLGRSPVAPRFAWPWAPKALVGQESSFDEVCFVVTEFRTFLGHGKHMNGETRQLLARWHALEAGDGLRRVAFTARVLWFVGLGLAMFVALAVTYRLHPAVVAAGAAVMGWTIAERNALRTRLTQWPVFKRYVDWNRVKQDLADAANDR